MPTVVPFRTSSAQTKTQDCPATELIRKELNTLTSNQYMIDTIIERMQPFIAELDYDLSLHVEVNENTEEAMLDLAPAVQDLQTRFSNLLAEIIAERILREIALFHAENTSRSK